MRRRGSADLIVVLADIVAVIAVLTMMLIVVAVIVMAMNTIIAHCTITRNSAVVGMIQIEACL